LLGWAPPTPPHIKLNFDAAISEGVTGLAVVCRDQMAKLLFIWTDLIKLDDPLMAEANAALLATRKATEVGFQSVIVEGDSLKVIQAIQGIPEVYIWSIDNVIFDIRSLLSKLSFWNASHVFRELNTVAHSVAR
jgi:ribonuclease HI